jgi:arylsulfatase
LDGYDQTNMITGKGPSNRHEVWYFAESELGAVRIDDYKYRFIDQPGLYSARIHIHTRGALGGG